MLWKTNTVDAVLHDPKTDSYELVLGVEAGEWQHPDALQQLKDKVDGTAAFALDGEMHERYPASRGRPVTVTLLSVDPVPPFFQKWLDAITGVLARENLPLTVKRPPQPIAA